MYDSQQLRVEHLIKEHRSHRSAWPGVFSITATWAAGTVRGESSLKIISRFSGPTGERFTAEREYHADGSKTDRLVLEPGTVLRVGPLSLETD